MGVAIVLRGDRGLKLYLNSLSRQAATVAIVLRGDRGLKRFQESDRYRRRSCSDRPSGRSRIETKGYLPPFQPLPVAIVLRGDRGLKHWVWQSKSSHRSLVAIVLRGDRGLKQHDRLGVTFFIESSDRPSGRSRIETSSVTGAGRSVSAVAIVLRGDRGLKPKIYPTLTSLVCGSDRPSGQSQGLK